MGYQTPTWWQHCDLQSFSPPVSSHSLATMFSHLREGIHWLGAGMKLLQHQSFVRISQDYKLILYAVLCCKRYPLPLHLNNHFCHYYISKREFLPIFCEWHDGDGLSIGWFIKVYNSHTTSLSLLHGSNLSPSGQSIRRVALHFHFTHVWSIKAWHGAVNNAHVWSRTTTAILPRGDLLWWGFAIFVLHKYLPCPVFCFWKSLQFNPVTTLCRGKNGGKNDTAFLMVVSLNIYLIKMKHCSGPEYKC